MMRMAVVQMDYNPACIIKERNLLEDPSFYKEGVKCLISLELPYKEQADLIAFKEKVFTSYLRMLERRVEHILSFLHKKAVRFVLFPEYSIPPPLFPLLHGYAKKGMVIVGGTHTCSLEYQQYYKEVKIRPEEGKNICVVFLPDGEVEWVEKLSPFSWEEKIMRLGNKWGLLSVNDEFRFAVFVSCDFTNTSHENRIKYAKVEDYHGADFFCVPAFSCWSEKFAEELLKRAEKIRKITLHANIAMDGRSTILAPLKESLYMKKERGLFKGEEGIIIMDVDIKASYAKPFSKEVAVIPFIYEGSLPHFDEFQREYMRAEDVDEKKKVIEDWEEKLFDWWRKKKELRTFGKKVEIMLCDYKRMQKMEELDFFMDALVFPKGVQKVDEWRFMMMGEAIKFLQRFQKYTKSPKKVEELIVFYKRQQQTLKDKVRDEYFEYYYLHKKKIQRYAPMKVEKQNWFYKRWGEDECKNPMDKLIYRPLLTKEEIEQCYILTEKMKSFLKEFQGRCYLFVSAPSTGKTSLLAYLSWLLKEDGKEVIWIMEGVPSLASFLERVKRGEADYVVVFDDIEKYPEAIKFIEDLLAKFPSAYILCTSTKEIDSLPKEFEIVHLPGYLGKEDIKELPVDEELKEMLPDSFTFTELVLSYKRQKFVQSGFEEIYQQLGDGARFCAKILSWAEGMESNALFSVMETAGVKKEVLQSLIEEGLVYQDIRYRICPDLRRERILRVPSNFAEFLQTSGHTLKYEKERMFAELLLEVGTLETLICLFSKFEELSERQKSEYIEALSAHKEKVAALWMLSCLCIKKFELLKLGDYVKQKLEDTKDGGHARMLLNFAVAYHRDGQPQKCLEYLKYAVSLYEKDPLLWYNLGTASGLVGDVNEQINCYLKAANLGMDDPLLWYGLATAYGEKKELEKEIRCYRRCVSLDPNSATAWYNLGLALGKRKEEEEEMNCYKKAVSINPEDPLIWYNLGLLYGKKGQMEQQIECYEKALNYDPEDALIWYNLGLLYGKKGEKEKEMHCYAKAVQIEPEYERAWYNLGVLYGEMGEAEKEMRCYERAITINPEDAMAWYNLGLVYGKRGRVEEEIRCYKNAIEIEPEYEKAWYNLGVVYQDKKQLDKAIECYQQAISINPEDAKAWQNLGFAYRDKGQTEDAMKCFERARRLKTTH